MRNNVIILLTPSTARKSDKPGRSRIIRSLYAYSREMSKWACHLCLFTNSADAMRCKLCDMPAEASTSQAAAGKANNEPESPSLYGCGDDFADFGDYVDIEQQTGSTTKKSIWQLERSISAPIMESIETFDEPTEATDASDAATPVITDISGKKRGRKTTEAAALLRAEKAALKAAQKEKNAQHRVAEQISRGSYAISEIAPCFEQNFASSDVGIALQEALSAYFNVLPPRMHPIANSIVWKRRRVDPTSKGTSFVPGHESDEPFLAVFWHGSDYVEMLKRYGTDGMQAYLHAARSILEPGTRAIFIVQGAAAYIAAQLKKADGARRKGTSAIDPVLTQDGLEAANMHLYVTEHLEIKDTTSVADTAEYLTNITRAVAETPYRMLPSALAVVAKVKVARSIWGTEDEDTAKSTRAKSLSEMWYAQLQMIPGVSSRKALAIMTKFPSIRALLDRYRDPAIPLKDKEIALEDVLMDVTGKKMTKLSKDIFRLFNSTDPETMIGSEG